MVSLLRISRLSCRGLLQLSAVCDLGTSLGWIFFMLVTVCGWLWLRAVVCVCIAMLRLSAAVVRGPLR